MSDEQPEPPIEDTPALRAGASVQYFLTGANEMRRRPITDREMWIAIRSGLLGIVKAIEAYGSGSPLATAVRASLLGIVSAIELRWNLKRHKTN